MPRRLRGDPADAVSTLSAGTVLRFRQPYLLLLSVQHLPGSLQRVGLSQLFQSLRHRRRWGIEGFRLRLPRSRRDCYVSNLILRSHRRPRGSHQRFVRCLPSTQRNLRAVCRK